MEYVQLSMDEYIKSKNDIKNNLGGIVKSFVRIGWQLTRIDRSGAYKNDGYSSIAEFAAAEYGMNRTGVSRFMNVYETYSADGDTPELKEQYREFKFSQLTELLQVQETDRQMFTPEVGKVIMALMVMSCCGSLLGWQFTIAQVFKSSSDEGYFPKIFSRVTKVDAPVQGMLTIVIIQSGLALMTISPSLNSQFNVLVNLAVVTNIIPYILSMAALVIIQKVANVPPSKAKVANFVAFVGAMYSFYALYSSGEEAMLYGSIVTFLGWTLYGLVSPRFELKNKHG